MRKNLLLTLLLILSLPTFIACSDDDSPTDPGTGGESTNVKFITENVTQTTIWYSDTIYVINKYDFYVEASLQIQPGTVIKFHPTDGPYLVLGSNGTIIANGTSTNPIIFTSYKDDSHGGDTNGDGAITQPAKGDWLDINLNDQNGSIFNYCEFYYGGNGSYNYTLTLFGTMNVHVTNCTFAHNIGGKSGDFYYGALDASEAESGTVITGNIFYDNNLPLSISTEFNLDNSNVFHDPDNPTTTNTMNGIFVYAISEISKSIAWYEDEVAFVISDNDLWVENSSTISVYDNVVVKFTPSSELLVESGSQINYGSNVYFTSFKDDTHGGDTNGDGAISSPGNGDWGGIYHDPSSTYYSWTNILYDSH